MLAQERNLVDQTSDSALLYKQRRSATPVTISLRCVRTIFMHFPSPASQAHGIVCLCARSVAALRCILTNVLKPQRTSMMLTSSSLGSYVQADGAEDRAADAENYRKASFEWNYHAGSVIQRSL